MKFIKKGKRQDRTDGIEAFWRFRVRYRELTGCRPPRAPSCVSACAALVSEFGEERVLAALGKWVCKHEDAEDLSEDTHRPGDFLLEDAREMLRTPAPLAEPCPASIMIPRVSLIDLGPGQVHAATGQLSAAVFAQPEAAACHAAQRSAARAAPVNGGAPASFASCGGMDAGRSPLAARELRKSGK